MISSIDIARLEKVRRHGVTITARCPACAAAGGDKKGTHFFLNTESGKFGCAGFQGDGEHRREIFAIVGIKTERDPAEDRAWKQARLAEAAAAVKIAKVNRALLEKRASIVVANRWSMAECIADSPSLCENDPRTFIAALFDPAAVVWTGSVRHSGTNHASHWRTAKEWLAATPDDCGPFTSPATWPLGVVTRTAANVESAPYVVLDFDGMDGKAPSNAEELEAHIVASLSITRWLRDGLGWRLAAVVWTGSKSIHAWFHTPPKAALDSLKNTASVLGIDPGLIGRAEHPCRLPGWLHQKTGNPSQLLWLNSPTNPTNQPFYEY